VRATVGLLEAKRGGYRGVVHRLIKEKTQNGGGERRKQGEMQKTRTHIQDQTNKTSLFSKSLGGALCQWKEQQFARMGDPIQHPDENSG